MLIDSTITKIDFLKRLGCEECLHGSDTLLHHLIGTRDLLKHWGAEEYVQDAGLFHSVYGTEYFQPNIKVTRDQVREIIGIKAECLVDMFCFCQRGMVECRVSIGSLNYKSLCINLWL